MKRISAKTLVGNIRAGLDDSALMERHRLTHESLQYVLTKLVQEGLVSSMELYERTTLSDSSITRSFKETSESVLRCPSCGKEVSGQLDRCPCCETIEMDAKIELLVDVDPSANPSTTPIYSHARTGPISEHTVAAMVDGLFEHKAESNSSEGTHPSKAKKNSRNRVLLKAASRGPLRSVKQLLNKGADVNARGKYRSTPLMRSSFKGHSDISRLLLEHGADVNAANALGNTALIVAATFGHTEIVALLLAKGANVSARNADGKTPLKYAKEKGHGKAAELLQRYGAKE